MSLRFVFSGLLLATALVLGLFAYRISHEGQGVAGGPTAAPVMVSYLVAARPVPPGTLVRNEDFVTKSVATGKLPPEAIVDTPQARDDVRGALIRTFVETGKPLRTEDYVRPKDRGFLAAALAPGTRAVSIGVTAITGVAGLIWPGDYVDVILTQELAPSTPGAKQIVSSETVLANVRIIAVGQDLTQGGGSNSASAEAAAGHTNTTVTLQTSVNQAERLAVAGQLGHLSLAVRAWEKGEAVNDATGAAVSGSDVSKALSKASVESGSHLELIQGGQRSEVTFK
jgi:pilus assembly protein CpaB